MISQTGEYALRAVLYLAREGQGEPVPVEAIANALDLPRNYLSKTLHTLAKRGVLDSMRGPHGGYTLSKPADRVPLYEIVEPFDQLEERETCLLGRTRCDERSPCAAHRAWRDVTSHVVRFFRETTVHDLLGDDAPEQEDAGSEDAA